MGRLLRDPNNVSTKLIQRHKGVKVVKNPRNGYTVVWLHYSADPKKNELWAEKERYTYPSLDQWNQEMEIDFSKSAGRRVFPMAKVEQHVYRISPIPNVPIWRFWDFGYHHPACIFAQVTNNGVLHVLSEMLGEDMTIHVFGRKVLDFCAKKYHGYSFRDAGDPAGAQRNDKSEDSSIDILRDSRGENGFADHICGPIRVQYRKLAQPKGLELIRSLMLPAAGTGGDFITDDGEQIPAFIRFKVDKSCEDLIDGMLGGYRLKENSDDPDKDGYYDHLFDALRYGCQVIFDHITARPMQPGRFTSRRRYGTHDKATGY